LDPVITSGGVFVLFSHGMVTGLVAATQTVGINGAVAEQLKEQTNED